ncbi:uncharacterized protein LOC134838292 [Culicoides brevitarsis]|uniref:uncharacterized protein LOC134838292 n=1 Tax=Culicoides brevitarsis TaxID=469753 RepID=UPI00307BF49D
MSPAAGLTQAVVSLNSNSLRDIPIATSSPLPLGTSAAGLINANATMAAVLAGGTQAVAQAPSTSTAGSSSVAATQQQQAASASAASGTQASQGVENYQFLLPRIFEPSLTEEEIQQRENERAERADYCNEVIFQALRLRDPVRYLVSSDDESDDSDDTDDSDSSLRPTIKPIRVTKSKHKKVTEPPPAATRPETANASTQSEQSSADAMPAGSLQQESVVVTAAATANPNSSHRKIVVNKSTTTRPVSQHQQSAKLAKQQSGPDTR